MKKFVLIFAASIASFSCLQGKALGNSSLLLQVPPMLAAANRLAEFSVINENVIVIDKNSSTDIISASIDETGDTKITLTGDISATAQEGSVLYIPPGTDSRFPLGIAGRIASLSSANAMNFVASNIDATKTVTLERVSYADIFSESKLDLSNITLDTSNFVGVIAPAAVQAASPMSIAAANVSGKEVYSFRNGAVIVEGVDQKNALSSTIENNIADGVIEFNKISINTMIELGEIINIDASRMKPRDANLPVGFSVKGTLDKVKITNKHDFSMTNGGLKSLDLRLDGNLDFDVQLINADGYAKIGYFSQAWDEVADQSFKALGMSAKLSGLSSKDKIGKYPIAGLVFSFKCPLQKPCYSLPGKTQTPVRNAEVGGFILWLYLIGDLELSLNCDLHLAHLNSAGLSVGINKPYGGDFNLVRSLTKNNSESCFLEALQLDGKAAIQGRLGLAVDLDFFAAGIRFANVGLDAGGLAKAEVDGNFGYCVEEFGVPGSWQGKVCGSVGLGAGAISRASAKFGVKIDTAWKDISSDLEYGYQIPNEEEMETEGRHGLWYYRPLYSFGTCESEPQPVTSATGRVWMDRNLGASRVATSMTDAAAYGDLYQWGRGKDGHEKRTSGTTATLSSSDNPGHSNFITTTSEPQDWRSPQNNNLWQGTSGVNNPCPSGFRLPTADEWQTEMTSWSSKNAAGAFASPLKLVMAGIRSSDGTVYGGGNFGMYWSSTAMMNNAFHVDGTSYSMTAYSRANGLGVRCIKNEGVNEGLVAHYDFEDNANDSSGNGNNGVAYGGVSYVNGVKGKAVQIGDCSNPGHIQVPNSDSLKFNNVFTVSYYVRIDSELGMDGINSGCGNFGQRTVFAKDHDRSGYFNHINIDSSGTFASFFSNNRYAYPKIEASAIKEGSFGIGGWTHVALVINGNEIIGYINGQETNRYNDLNIDLSIGNSRDLYIGKFSDSWFPLGGSIDDFRLYNRALSGAEIIQIYNEVSQ